MLTENEWLIVAHNILLYKVDAVLAYCEEHPNEEYVGQAASASLKLAKACTMIKELVEESEEQGVGRKAVKIDGYVIIPQEVAERMLKRLEDVSFSTEEDLEDIAALKEAIG